jgi:hypothetical protein
MLGRCHEDFSPAKLVGGIGQPKTSVVCVAVEVEEYLHFLGLCAALEML